MWKSNGALMERVQSPVIYREENGLQAVLQTFSQRCFAPVAAMHHYLGMAGNSFFEVSGKEEVKLKKLFYALRATLCCKWILEKETVPPIVFMTMVNELDFALELKSRIVSLIELKSGKPESYMHPAEKEIAAFIAQELAIATAAFDTLPGRKEKNIDLDLSLIHI